MTELKDLTGLGPKRLQALQEAGVSTLYDLLRRLPVSYKDTTRPTPIASVRPGQEACVQGYLREAPKLQRFSGRTMVTAVLSDDTGSIPLRYFNQPWMKDTLRPGAEYLMFGRCGEFRGRAMLLSPSVEQERALIPKYRPVAGVAPKTYAGWVRQALMHADEALSEPLPAETLSRHGLMGIVQAVRAAHCPDSEEALLSARRRFDFEELLLYQAALSRLRAQVRQGYPFSFDENAQQIYWESLPFAPTNAQKRTLEDIAGDLQKAAPMSRLVQGDVGCGKTAVAFGAIYLAFRAGFQSALMAPTEILARQHFESAKRTLEPLGLTCGLLTGKLRQGEKREAAQRIQSGEWDVVIGTHALISQGIEYSRLGLVITDEQHRFGVRQRRVLAQKADREPHTLVMSATPIPRSLALVLYGDLELSVIDELPPGRTPVKTRVVPEDKREGLYRFIISQASQGHQTYIVCPLVEESEALDVPSVQQVYAELCEGPLKSLRLGLTWGAQPAEEKERVIGAFSSGQLDVLVSTTVIEVGVNVPSATVMVIESADRFGLSQLHQLRGRVGRGASESWCFLLAHKNERLDALCRTNDGFEIAREDLRQRGPGELMGTRQHGEPVLSGLKEGYDIGLIEQTRQELRTLSGPGHEQALRQVLDSAEKAWQRALDTVAFN